MTPTERAGFASLVAAARVLWVRLGDATDADVNRLGAALIAATALLQAQNDKGIMRDDGDLSSRHDHTTADAVTTPE